MDPFGGSYYLEAMTGEIEARALAVIKRVKDLGGVVPALEKGYFHREIAETAYRFERDLTSKRRKIVGVNVFQSGGERPSILKIHSSVERGQVKALKKLKKDRDNAAVAAALEALRRAARGTDNLLPPIIAAVKAYATVGEMTNALQDVFGEYPAFRS